jgi:hypothetical protein
MKSSLETVHHRHDDDEVATPSMIPVKENPAMTEMALLAPAQITAASIRS